MSARCPTTSPAPPPRDRSWWSSSGAATASTPRSTSTVTSWTPSMPRRWPAWSAWRTGWPEPTSHWPIHGAMPDPVPGPPDAEPRTAADYERWFRVLDAQMRVLERERQKLSAIMNHADAGFVVMDTDRRILWANDAVARIVRNAGGRSAVEGRHCREVVCGSDEPCAACPAVAPFVTGTVA